MRDLPAGPQLLALARAVLLDELLPLLPADRKIDGLLVAGCLAIAEREAAAGARPMAAAPELAQLYRSADAPADAPPAGEPSAGAGEGDELWRRFARDLRNGAFEGSEARERRVRAVLWRLTLEKLRLANPKFLDANGLA